MTAASPRLDIVSDNAGENVRRVQARDLGAPVVQTVFRLVKQASLHSLDNQAVVRQVEDATATLVDYGQRTDQNISILFAYGSVMVGGQLLKANRQVYEGAMELGEILKKYGFSELAIAKNVTAQDLFAFVSAIGEAHRQGRAASLERPSPRIRLRAVADAALRRGAAVEHLEPEQAVVRMYASAVVIMRRFFEKLQRGIYELPQRVKRISQMLVDLSKGDTPAFLGVTAARNANQDEAGRCVNCAILAVSIARQITEDVLILGRLAMSALLFDAARARLTGTVGPNPPAITPRLSEAQEMESPAATAAVLTGLGHINEPSIMRTVMAYEAHWIQKASLLGPVYGGARAATLQSRIIAIARRFNDLLTPPPGSEAPTADDVIGRLGSEASDPADHTVVRLLIAALGIFPTGTVVQLGSSEIALVVAAPAHPSLYALPRVRALYDQNGHPLAQPATFDLSSLDSDNPRKRILGIVAPADEATRAQAAAARQTATELTTDKPVPKREVSAEWPSASSGVSSPQHSAFTPTSSLSARHDPSYPGDREPSRQGPLTPAEEDDDKATRALAWGADSAKLVAGNSRSPAALDPSRGTGEVHIHGASGPEEPKRSTQEIRLRPPTAVASSRTGEMRTGEVRTGEVQRPTPGPSASTAGARAPEARTPSESRPVPVIPAIWAHPDNEMDAPPAPTSPTPRGQTPIPAAPLAQRSSETHPGGVHRAATIPAAAHRVATQPAPVHRAPTQPAPPARSPTQSVPQPVVRPPTASPEPPRGQEVPLPTAEGTLVKSPFVHLLVYMLDQQLSGTTVFQTPDGIHHAIYFDKGTPAKARTGGMVAPLDRVLLEMGVLDEMSLRHSLMEIVKKKVLHGRFLVSKGLIDGATVLKALKQQLIRKVVYFFELPRETRYAFYADHNLLEHYGGPELTPVEPLALIMTGVRTRSEDPIVEQTLARIAGRQIGLHIDSELKRFELHRDEAAVADLLRIRKMTLQELHDAQVAAPHVVNITIYALAITRHLSIVGVKTRPPVGVLPRARPPSPIEYDQTELTFSGQGEAPDGNSGAGGS